MEKNALHIWARGEFMMIALPNFDGSFTCTFFLAFKGENSFEQLDNEKSLLEFFQTNFPDAIPLMPTLIEDFFTNPTGNLGTIKCLPWNIGGKALLLGDSAHAMVPFYGQGMNARLKTAACLIADRKTRHKLGKGFRRIRRCKENRTPTRSAIWRKKISTKCAMPSPIRFSSENANSKPNSNTNFPDYFSKYSMVTFREDLPYTIAKEKGNAQDKLLMEICANVENVGEIDLNEVIEKVKLVEECK